MVAAGDGFAHATRNNPTSAFRIRSSTGQHGKRFTGAEAHAPPAREVISRVFNAQQPCASAFAIGVPATARQFVGVARTTLASWPSASPRSPAPKSPSKSASIPRSRRRGAALAELRRASSEGMHARRLHVQGLREDVPLRRRRALGGAQRARRSVRVTRSAAEDLRRSAREATREPPRLSTSLGPATRCFVARSARGGAVWSRTT